jgi:hypothetical protein
MVLKQLMLKKRKKMLQRLLLQLQLPLLLLMPRSNIY